MTIRVGAAGTRGARVPNRGPLAALFRLMGKRQVRTYRRFDGQRLSSRMGFPVVLLTTRGAKTGLTRWASKLPSRAGLVVASPTSD